MSIRKTKKKNKRNDFHWKSCGPVLEELRLRKVRGDLHLACLVCIARKNVPDRDLPFTSFANDGGGWEMLGKTWDKKGLGSRYLQDEWLHHYITSHPHHPKGLELLQRHNRRLHPRAVHRNADTSRRCHPRRIVQLPLPWRALKLKSSSGLYKGHSLRQRCLQPPTKTNMKT